MFGFKKKNNSIVAPCKGVIVPITEVEDKVFSTKTMGDGFAIQGSDGKVFSPVEGEITMVFPTRHAVGIRDKKGVEYILHSGIDTVELKGEGFEIFVKENQSVKQGAPVMKMDVEILKERGYKSDVIVVCVERDDLSLSKTYISVEAGESIGHLTK